LSAPGLVYVEVMPTGSSNSALFLNVSVKNIILCDRYILPTWNWHIPLLGQVFVTEIQTQIWAHHPFQAASFDLLNHNRKFFSTFKENNKMI
jgi:hypothetical protein